MNTLVSLRWMIRAEHEEDRDKMMKSLRKPRVTWQGLGIKGKKKTSFNLPYHLGHATILSQPWLLLIQFRSSHAICIGVGNDNPLQYSCLENPRDGGAWRGAVYGVAQSRTRLKRLSSSNMPSVMTYTTWGTLESVFCRNQQIYLLMTGDSSTGVMINIQWHVPESVHCAYWDPWDYPGNQPSPHCSKHTHIYWVHWIFRYSVWFYHCNGHVTFVFYGV